LRGIYLYFSVKHTGMSMGDGTIFSIGKGKSVFYQG